MSPAASAAVSRGAGVKGSPAVLFRKKKKKNEGWRDGGRRGANDVWEEAGGDRRRGGRTGM